MLPTITNLQFVVLCELTVGEKAGHVIRAALAKEKIKKSGPSFYQLMARLEKAKLVKGWYEKKTIKNQVIRERRYKITSKGRSAVRSFKAFTTRGLGIAT